MLVVDISAWIEWLIDSSTGRDLQEEIPSREEWVVPTIVQLELAKWLVREVGEDKADQVIAFTQLCLVAPLDTKLSLAAAEFCAKHKLATADAIVYATALDYDASLLTCDAHFKDLPSVRYVPKRP
ncbi:type II toxin-antitoxin system VapC family toxin [Methylocystis parvus]|uniref:Ribonuclease VapC n=1 Tax=Methylocystis parvus TaxID=134 RepID=A0A6B8MEE0_9HYPH|nr:type II toxin-antitoxin system VapC family toxin [Methylocystis parvus]QGM99000.1 type II toxin-antitoxin system VapC family toxin [Methylocystis parvus]WBK00639.1 type II toxin-antitoxin system VapC family toxin [Methylocystis parvus OBBP]